MRIKKHKNKNEYLLTSSKLWVRNFTKKNVPSIDLNNLINKDDYSIILENEIINNRKKYPWIETGNFKFNNIVILSDGFDYKEKHRILKNLDVCIITVNRALAKWDIKEKSPNFFVVNNPYPECMNYISANENSPKCIASTRTNHEFLSQYNGTKYRYCPVADMYYKAPKINEVNYEIDDYRNSICAAIGLAYHFKVKKLLLMCCDDSFADERPGAERVGNLWQYPSQSIAHDLIDANLFWLKKTGLIEIKNCSSGKEYKNAMYINSGEICSFFEDKK